MLNKEQQLAVDCNDKKILCLAPAGSGKTRVLIARVDHLVNSGVLPTQILALTFTNAAANEMRERFQNSHPDMICPEFRTFHSFAYSLICKDSQVRTALGYNTIPEIASEEFEKEIHERVIAQCKITLSRDKLAIRKDLNRAERRQLELYDKAFARLMKREDQITFDMLNREVADLFHSHHPSTDKYMDQYKYLLVDEVQDVDGTQIDFIASFNARSNYFLTGDALQNIYSWRGSDNKYIKRLAKSEGWTKIKLLENYRSTRQICEYANNFSSTYADDSYRIAMHSDREGPEVVEYDIDGPEDYDPIDLNDIDTMIKDLAPLSGTSAILCRTNKEVTAICDYLKAHNIEYCAQKETKAIKLIECALSDKFMIGYLASHLSSSKYGEYIRVTTNKAPDIKGFLSMYGDNPKIASDSKKILKLREISTLLINTADKIKEVKKIFKVNIPIPEDPDLFGKDFLKYIQTSVEEIKSNELYVGTIHSVKGLEYDNVCVANVNSYCFQLGDEEMNNLFYVAITRAKNRLFIYKIF